MLAICNRRLARISQTYHHKRPLLTEYHRWNDNQSVVRRLGAPGSGVPERLLLCFRCHRFYPREQNESFWRMKVRQWTQEHNRVVKYNRAMRINSRAPYRFNRVKGGICEWEKQARGKKAVCPRCVLMRVIENELSGKQREEKLKCHGIVEVPGPLIVID